MNQREKVRAHIHLNSSQNAEQQDQIVKMMNKYQMYPNSSLWFKESNEQSKATLHIEDLYTI